MSSATIGQVIKYLREKNGWTLKDLEKRTGIMYSTISEIETGKTGFPRQITLEKFAYAFGMDLQEFQSLKNSLIINETEKEADEISEIYEHCFDDPEMTKWLKTPESKPYIEFAYSLFKKGVTKDLLKVLIGN